MKLEIFHSNVHLLPPLVSEPTKSFQIGFADVEEIQATPSSVWIRRHRLPDIIITAMGVGIVSVDPAPIPAGTGKKRKDALPL